jgi:hypothetical protein
VIILQDDVGESCVYGGVQTHVADVALKCPLPQLALPHSGGLYGGTHGPHLLPMAIAPLRHVNLSHVLESKNSFVALFVVLHWQWT